MSTNTKFNGVLKQIALRYPNVEVAEYLQDELRLTPDKAEALTARIQKKFLTKPENPSRQARMLLEKPDTEVPAKESAYCVDSLSEKEFEHFIKWLFKELGYEVSEGEATSDLSVNFMATNGTEKIAVVAVRCPINLKVSSLSVLMAQHAQQASICNRSIVVASACFTGQAVSDAQKANVELWDNDVLAQKISEEKEKAELDVESSFPKFEGSLLRSLLRLEETKDFFIEPKAGEKYDLRLQGVKYPLLTFQAQNGCVTRLVYRIKYNEPVGENEGETLIGVDGNQRRIGPGDAEAYVLVTGYLEQFLK